MQLLLALKAALETEELRTVSDAFGGIKCDGKTPSFNIDSVLTTLAHSCAFYPTDPISVSIGLLRTQLSQKECDFVVGSLIRFCFLIELTNISITSTKMKTRWMPAKIIRTIPGSFQNYKADFVPGMDQRAMIFDECAKIFDSALRGLLAHPGHLAIARALTLDSNRSVSFESVLTYIDPSLNPVHIASNVRLVDLTDISWLVKNRSIIREALTLKNIKKLKTKTYLTDRSQVGADQTNRAKRWEVLSADYQHATLEECWSVERELLTQLLAFHNFPREIIVKVGGSGHVVRLHRCPVTHVEFDFVSFTNESSHGKSSFQVGHLIPLRSGGRHVANNVAWVTEDGNRIQGNLSLSEVHKLLNGIYGRGLTLGLYP